MPVFATWSKPEGPDPLSILAHQLRRRFPPNRSLLRGARSFYSTAPPEGSLVFRPFRPGFWNRGPSKPKPSDVLRPFLGEPLLRPALLTRSHEEIQEPRRAREEHSSGASSRLAREEPKPLPFLPAEIGPLVTCRALVPLPALGEAGTAVPITPAQCTPHPSRESEIFGVEPVDNGDIGYNIRNLLQFARSAAVRLPFRSLQLTSEGCPKPPPSPTIRPICAA
jgi:hypothetical protein